MVSGFSYIPYKKSANEVGISCVQDHPFPNGKLPYEWTSVTDYWPRRLLHIPSMNSIERDESDVYSGVSGVEKVKKPKYNILTYTWGRWRMTNVKGCRALPVLNTPWDIPAIKEEHFTVEEFQKVVNLLGRDGIDWAWIDVACINQEDEEDNAEEVGRQASIFKNAHQVFVWLSRLPKDVLASSVTNIQESSLGVRDYIDDLPTPRSIEDLISSLHKDFKIFFADPWFSSLWTLQEVILRNDAVALPKEAEAIMWDPGHNLYLTMFINHCQNMFQDLEHLEKKVEASTNRYLPLGSERQEMKKQVREMKQLILQAGFHFLFSTNPNVQYGIAQYRTTSRDVDRVYAIMQTYNLRVGKSIRPNEQPPLAELIDEFAAAINKKCPIMGQMFIHTQAPQPSKSWRITQASTVPDDLMIYKEPRPKSELTMRSRTMVARGLRCPFAEIFSMVRSIQREMQFGGVDFELALDTHVIDGLGIQQSRAASSLSSERMLGLQVLMQYGRENVWVLWLGDVRGVWSSPRGRFNRRQVGLVLICTDQGEDEDRKRLRYQRLGVCTWTDLDIIAEKAMDELSWDETELQLH